MTTGDFIRYPVTGYWVKIETNRQDVIQILLTRAPRMRKGYIFKMPEPYVAQVAIFDEIIDILMSKSAENEDCFLNFSGQWYQLQIDILETRN